MSTVWMSTTGDDANPGTKNEPKASFGACYAALPPGGGTVRLHAGHYDARDFTWPRPGVIVIGAGCGYRPSAWWRRVWRRAHRATILRLP